MEIRLIRPEKGGNPKIPTDRIVHVSVLERHGNEALIDLNGNKVKAVLETDVPDRFLAFVEKQADGNYKLRVAGKAGNEESFMGKSGERILQTVKEFLLSMNLPVTKEFLSLASWMRKSGQALDAGILRLLHRLAGKYGEGFASVYSAMLGKGLSAPPDFGELLARLPALIAKVLDGGEKENPSADAVDSAEETFNRVLEKFVPGLEKSIFWKERAEDDTEDLLHYRKWNINGVTAYDFELTRENGENSLLHAEKWPEGWNLRLELDPALYLAWESTAEFSGDRLEKHLRSLSGSERLTLAVRRRESAWDSWKDCISRNYRETVGLTDLDISV